MASKEINHVVSLCATFEKHGTVDCKCYVMSSFLLSIFLQRIHTHHVSVSFGIMVGAASMYLFFDQVDSWAVGENKSRNV